MRRTRRGRPGVWERLPEPAQRRGVALGMVFLGGTSARAHRKANGSAADTSLKDHGLAYNHQLRDIYIVDFGGRRQYSIGSAAQCLCSTFRNGDGGVVRTGERREFWAWHGLPPAGARQMAIQIPDQPPIMDVPLL